MECWIDSGVFVVLQPFVFLALSRELYALGGWQHVDTGTLCSAMVTLGCAKSKKRPILTLQTGSPDAYEDQIEGGCTYEYRKANSRPYECNWRQIREVTMVRRVVVKGLSRNDNFVSLPLSPSSLYSSIDYLPASQSTYLVHIPIFQGNRRTITRHFKRQYEVHYHSRYRLPRHSRSRQLAQQHRKDSCSY